MVKDKRYIAIKKLISVGDITFPEIFDMLPKSVVAYDLRMNNTRISKLINNVDLFVVKDIIRLANLFEVDGRILLNLIYDQFEADKKNKK